DLAVFGYQPVLWIEHALEVEDILVQVEVLHRHAVGRGGDEVDVGVGVPVGGHLHVVSGGEVGDLHPLAHAAQHVGVGLENLGGAGGDDVAEAPARGLYLARGHRHRHGGGNLGAGLERVGVGR